MPDNIDVPVLIVGAGGAGLTASMLLSDLGIETYTITYADSTSILPKAHVLQQRAMEAFRSCGVADDIYAKSAPPEAIAATAWYAGVVGDRPDAGRLIGKQQCWGAGGRDAEWSLASPCDQANLPQIRLEPILRMHAEAKAPGSIHFGHELIGLVQDDMGATATVRVKSSGEVYTVRARYVLGCDGGRFVGSQIGVELEGIRDIASIATVYFSADLSQWVRDPDVLLRWIWLPAAGDMATLAPMGPDHWGPDSEEWVCHRNYAIDDPRRLDDGAVVADMLEAFGLPDLDPTVHLVTRWSFEALVAPRFRVGWTFLLGDAAHRHGPTSGLGLTTAIQDARNIAWKIAAVLKGQASDALLDTYEVERKPVAERNVQRSTENAIHHAEIGMALGLSRDQSAEQNWAQIERLWKDGVDNAEYRRRVRSALALQSTEFNEHNVEYGYRYESGAVVPDDAVPPLSVDPVRVYVPSTYPGGPVPHAWLTDENGELTAVMDLIRPGEFLLIASEHGDDWISAAKAVSEQTGLGVRGVRLGHADGDYFDVRLSWLRRREVGDDGAVLVRPDGVVAWRSFDKPVDPSRALREAIDTVLSTTKVMS